MSGAHFVGVYCATDSKYMDKTLVVRRNICMRTYSTGSRCKTVSKIGKTHANKSRPFISPIKSYAKEKINRSTKPTIRDAMSIDNSPKNGWN